MLIYLLYTLTVHDPEQSMESCVGISLNVLSENNESAPATSLSLKRPLKSFIAPQEERPKTTINTAKNLSFIPYPYC